jgi:N-acetylneuraminic acid mutarotase
MKGDFSRLPLDPAASITGVWMQQGRVQLDADWNEQVALSAERARALAHDAMGGSGAPARDPGFQVTLRSALRLDGATTEAVVWNASGPGFDPGAPFTLEVRVAVRAGCAGTLLDRAGGYALSVSADGSITLRLDGPPPGEARAEPDASAAAPSDGAEAEGASAFDASSSPGIGAASAAAHRDTLTAPRAFPSQRPAWVTAVFDGASGCIYVDGELAAAGPVRAPAPSRGDDAPLTLGGAVRDGAPRGVVDGVLLEARVWGMARTPAQVRAGAARAPLPGTPGLAAWWPMDEGRGGWARDASGNGFDAELGGAGTAPPRWLEPSLFIGAGRYWVEGVGCENASEVPWSAQPSLPGARAPRGRGDALVYLEVWDRYLSAAEDPSLREVALAGGDTTGRTRTVWQVRAVELSREDEGEAEVRDPRGEDWSRHLPAPCGDGRMAARGTAAATDNRLYRVEVRGRGGAYGWPRPPAARADAVPVAAVPPGASEVRLEGSTAGRDGWRPGQWVELFSRATDAAGTAGTLHRVLRVADAEGGATLALDPPPPPVPAADNPRLRPVATFVWSADNGSSAWAVQALDVVGGTAVLDDGGRAGQLPVQGDWVEATDDAHALRGTPGPLCRVERMDGATLSVDLHPAPAGVSGDPRHHPVLRRWDPGPAGGGAERVVRGGAWVQLDGTVSVRFDAGGYRTGDWWTVPVREGAPTGIEWPASPAGPAALSPQGITRYAAPLALVRHRHGRARVHDLRQLLSPAHAGDFVRRTGPEWMTGPLHVHGDLAVGGTLQARLADGSVGTEQLAEHAVTRDKLAHYAVTHDRLAHHAVTTRKIEDGAVTHHKLAEHAVTTRKIEDGAVTHHKLAEHAVTTHKIEDGAVTHHKLAEHAVTTHKIEDGAVTHEKLAEHAVTTRTIEDGAVTKEKLAPGAFTADIPDSAVTAEKLANGAVTAEKLANGAVTKEKLAPGAFTADMIPNSAVTAEKLANGAVTKDKLAPGAFTADIPDSAVTAEKLANGAVTAEKLANGAVTAEKLAPGAFTANIPNGAVTEEKLASGAVTAISIADGAVLSVAIANGAVTAAAIANNAVTTTAIVDNAVTTAAIADNAVSWDQLGTDVQGMIKQWEPGQWQPGQGQQGQQGQGPEERPPRAAILTGSRVPPPGYAAMEGALAVPVATPAWRAVDALPLKDLAGAVCAALGGALYVLSGTAAELWRWWPEGGAWEPLAPPSRRRRGGALCAAGGRLHLLGGMDASENPVAAADAFDPATGTWASLAPLPTARAWMGAAELEGRVYAVGGRGERMALGHASAAVEAYDPAAGRWKSCRDMHLPRVHPAVAAAAGEVYAVGGASRVLLGAGRTATSESYDPAADRWTRQPRLPRPRMQSAVAALHDRLYVAGGREDDAPATADVRRLDPGAGAWVRFAPIPGPLRGPCAAAMDGVLYLVGGAGERGAPSTLLHACRLFTPLYPHRREG